MSRFSGQVERRLFNAVLLVLGACAPKETREPISMNEPPPPPAPDAGFATPPPGDAAVAEMPADASAGYAVPVDAAVIAPPSPQARASELCATYKKQARVDPTTAKQAKPPSEGFPVHEMAQWDAKSNVASCTIVHQSVPGKVTVMYTPHWCPQGGGSPPGPIAIQVDGQKILVERATLRPDGTLAKKSELEWTAYGTSNQPRHNCGRRFEGLALDETCASDEPGEQLARMAELEAASVPAFDRLARELAAWGAPAELVERARIAMRDEVRHARVMTALARQHGHAPRAIEVPALPCRSLAEIAHENAIEGCVREAYGALVATYQAERARPALRAAFRAIAVDERRHAELAEEVHAWILGRLDAESREDIVRARSRAEAELRESVRGLRACSELGLPGGSEAAALCDAYFA